MVNGSTKTPTKAEKSVRRISPHKDRSKKKTVSYVEKKNNSNGNELPEKPNAVPLKQLETTEEKEELLTPEFILKSYANKKSSNTTAPKQIAVLEDQTATKDKKQETNVNGTVGILELLSKKDNLEKISHSVSQAVDETKRTTSNSMEVPVKPVKTLKTPPSTPPKKSIPSERFAGLSNSPSPNNLPLPSFSFLDQELNSGKENDFPQQYLGSYQPATKLMPSPSPASNKQLETMSSQLRMMLNIAP